MPYAFRDREHKKRCSSGRRRLDSSWTCCICGVCGGVQERIGFMGAGPQRTGLGWRLSMQLATEAIGVGEITTRERESPLPGMGMTHLHTSFFFFLFPLNACWHHAKLPKSSAAKEYFLFPTAPPFFQRLRIEVGSKIPTPPGAGFEDSGVTKKEGQRVPRPTAPETGAEDSTLNPELR